MSACCLIRQIAMDQQGAFLLAPMWIGPFWLPQFASSHDLNLTDCSEEQAPSAKKIIFHHISENGGYETQVLSTLDS